MDNRCELAEGGHSGKHTTRMRNLSTKRWLMIRATIAWIALVSVGAAGAEKKSTARPGHWAFSVPKRPEIPGVTGASWCQTSVDRFVLRRLEQAQLRPAPRASRASLIRRATLDLTGLPPTPEDVASFVEDPSPDAFFRVTERLLESPQYGERWGRHWLDVARYADSGGFETDIFFGHAWRYRDYVVHALNSDKPYDQFIREQIAGDELEPGNPEALLATGLYTTGPVLQEAGMVPGKLEYDQLTDAVDTTGAAFLGLTLGCARCHDHKYDPISQRDYFSLQSFFAASDQFDLDPAGKRLRDRAALVNTQNEFELEQLRSRAKRETDPPLRRSLLRRLGDYYLAKDAQKREEEREFLANIAQKKAELRQPDSLIDGRETYRVALGERCLEGPSLIPTRVLAHRDQSLETRILKRGELDHPGDVVPSAVPAALHGEPCPTNLSPQQRRSALARWIASPQNPLTARIIVNRVWQWHLGQGLVRTPNDFGLRGEPPTHPELLDWMAVEFMEHGWSLKHLHRLILASSTWQMAASADPDTLAQDPGNRLLTRFQPHRLEAEVIWDSLRAISGTLNREMGGLSFAPPLDDQEMIGNFLKWPTSTPSESNRRALYILIKRSFRFPTLSSFDLPDNITSCGLRDITTVPNQALAMLNNRSMVEQAAAFAQRLITEAGANPERVVELAWRYSYGRPISEDERRRSLQFLEMPRNAPSVGESNPFQNALQELCLALFNTNEFIYIQ